MQQKQNYCQYYQAHVNRQQAWFFVAVVRSYEHMMFDRTVDTELSIFEFFVPKDAESDFLKVMKKLEEVGIVWDVRKLDNRLAIPGQLVS